jgi:Ni/Fe-hydrogenase subunit HybB-like protein
LLHTGRPWYAAFWLLPYPNQRHLWVNFRSPLLWDVFAVGTYFTISLVFWFVGLIPDVASVRDRAKNGVRKAIYTVLSMGWRGSNKNWSHYEMAYMILAGLSTPLVLSVHTIVSFDFAVSLIPGWHTTIFPPYFVAGAIFSGFAMVVTLLVIMREMFNLKNYVTLDHLEKMNKIIMATGMMVGYAYACEFFIAWYSGTPFETFTFVNRAFGPYWWAYWIMVSCNVLIPQIFWSRRARRHIGVMFVISLFVNIGMWFERYVIVVTSLHRDFLPSSWKYYIPTWYDWGWTFGSMGVFFSLFLLFVRFLPTIAMSEVKGVMAPADH